MVGGAYVCALTGQMSLQSLHRLEIKCFQGIFSIRIAKIVCWLGFEMYFAYYIMHKLNSNLEITLYDCNNTEPMICMLHSCVPVFWQWHTRDSSQEYPVFFCSHEVSFGVEDGFSRDVFREHGQYLSFEKRPFSITNTNLNLLETFKNSVWSKLLTNLFISD